MQPTLEVLFAPAEYSHLRERDLRQTVCVVFDVLRATSTMVTALGNGAAAILPVAEIPEALVLRQHHPEILLGVEIMSPVYSALRDGNKTAIPAEFLPKDYRPHGFRITE